MPQLTSYALYRWENNIRMAAVLGIVGAGGLGQMLYVSLALFKEAEVATVLIAMLTLVAMVDGTSVAAQVAGPTGFVTALLFVAVFRRTRDARSRTSPLDLPAARRFIVTTAKAF